MTKREMKDAIDHKCWEYTRCSDGCPLEHADGLCMDIESKDASEELVKLAYVTMFPPGESKDNPVTHPSHYTQGNIECIDAMVSAFGKEAVAHFCICNAFKYTWRSEHKNGMEDIDKALWYLNKYKELKSSD